MVKFSGFKGWTGDLNLGDKVRSRLESYAQVSGGKGRHTYKVGPVLTDRYKWSEMENPL